jgi:hypothetical protein
MLQQFRSWIARQLVANVPPEIHACEACREPSCNADRMRSCERRADAEIIERCAARRATR